MTQPTNSTKCKGCNYEAKYKEPWNWHTCGKKTKPNSTTSKDQQDIRERKTSDRLKQILDFLDGIAPLDGYWYGEKPEDRGTFWWRKELKPLIESELDKARRKGFDIGFKAAGGDVIPLEITELTQDKEEK